MDKDELISKKELLEKTGISYGQLYRWKRKKLIPEEWFIKKSSFTGQETFLPYEKVINRVEKILELKNQYSLEELQQYFLNYAEAGTVGIETLRSYSLDDLTQQWIKEKKKNRLLLVDLVSIWIFEEIIQISVHEKKYDTANKFISYLQEYKLIKENNVIKIYEIKNSTVGENFLVCQRDSDEYYISENCSLVESLLLYDGFLWSRKILQS